MELTPRIRRILQVLLSNQEPVSVKYVAEQVGVSKRTVQRELEYITSSLKPYRLQFQSRTGVGVWIEGTNEDRLKLLGEIEGRSDYDVTDREGRRKRLILEILKEKGLKKLFYYSSQFGISEATVSADLESIEGWLNEHELYIVRKPGSGISVEGSEDAYRRAIRSFIRENIDTKVIWDAYAETGVQKNYYDTLKKSNVSEILNDDIMRRVIDCISRIQDPRVLTLTEHSYVGLIIHISIAMNRMMKNELIEADERANMEIVKDDDYGLVKIIVDELGREFDLVIPQVEEVYIWLHIKGAKHEKIPFDVSPDREVKNREMQQLVNEMIDAFDPEWVYLLKQDEEFLQGLLAHLQPTLVRLMYGMKIQNPILDDIKSGYPDIFEKCKNVAKVLERSAKKPVPEEEIGFLTVHFGATIVRLQGRKEKLRKVHIGVVCSSGIGISRLMISKLEHAYGNRADFTAYGKNDVTPYVVSRTDFFITSIPMELEACIVEFVNPLLSDEDMDRVRHLIYEYERVPDSRAQEDPFSVQLEEVNLVATQIKLLIKNMQLLLVDEMIPFDELLLEIGELLSPYADQRECIFKDIMYREQISSQVFAEFGFALLHTRSQGVIRPEFAVILPKNRKQFADPYFKGISVVIVMLVPCDEKLKVNNELMGHISATLIEDYEFLNLICTGEKEVIREALSGHLKSYFNKFISGIS